MLNGHLSYRQEAHLRLQDHKTQMEKKREEALQQLRNINTGNPIHTISKGASPPPRGRPGTLSPRAKKSKTKIKPLWRKIVPEHGDVFYQNMNSQEVAWELPKNATLWSPALERERRAAAAAGIPYHAGYIVDEDGFVPLWDKLPSDDWESASKVAAANASDARMDKNRKSSQEEEADLVMIAEEALGVGYLKFAPRKQRFR